MTFSRLFLYGALLCLVACGGGGGGTSPVDTGGNDGNDDEEETSFDPPVDSAEPLEYEGVKLPAVLNTTNAGFFIYSALTDSEGFESARIVTDNGGSAVAGFGYAAVTVDDSNGAGDIDASAAGLPRLLRPLSFERIHTNARSGKKQLRSDKPGSGRFGIAAVSDSYDYAEKTSEACESGSIDTYLMLNQNGTGLMVLDYRNCLEEGVTIHGLVTYDIYDYNSEGITRATIRFNRLTNTADGLEFVSSGSVEYEYDYPLEQSVLNLIYRSESGGMLMLENMTFETQFEGIITQGNFSETISGRIYDSFLGYVDITTPRPVVYVNHIPQDGEMRLNGGDNSTVLLEFPGGNAVFTVRLDTDGDDVYENSAIFNLTRIASDETADIGDDDGDGMHNSWEAFYGLDPQDPADASLDPDGDSANNRSEYRLGYKPGDAGSAPPISDLEIYRQLLDGSAALELVVRNNGADAAGLVHTNITFSPGFHLDGVTPTSDCEITGNSVTCIFEELAEGESRVVRTRFDLSPDPGGYEAAVYSGSAADPDERNNALAESITPELKVRFMGYSTPTSYEVQVENTGIFVASDVYSQLVLPMGATLISIDNSLANGSCVPAFPNRVVACRHHSMQPGQIVTVAVSLTPAPGGDTEATFIAGASPLTPESDLKDNLVSFSGEPAGLVSDVGLSIPFKTFGNTGMKWGLIISPSTNGPNYRTAAEITIDLPPEIEFVSVNQNYQCADGHPLVCTIPRRVEFLSRSYPNLQLELRSHKPGIYEFPVMIETEADDPDLSNNMALAFAFVGDSTAPIQAQIDAADAGDIIEVPAGYYTGSLTYGKNIRLVGINGAANTFWSGYLRLEQVASGEITGFTFAHNGSPAIGLLGSAVNVHHNIFEYRTGPGIEVSNSGATIEKNIFRHSACDPDSSGVITIFRNSSPLIRNNLFLHNVCTGIFSAPSFDEISGEPVIVNNTFYGNAIGAITLPASSGLEFHFGNNIFRDNNVALKMVTDCGMDCPVFSSNLFYGNSSDYANIPDQTGTNGNINADPMFTDIADEDFTLQHSSPAIDSGDILNAPTDDFNGNPRPVDGDGSGTTEPDIGAYEFQ